MKASRVSLLALLSALPCASIAFAQSVPREYKSARHLGMGDAGVASPSGYDAIFYNPAGISDTKGILNEAAVLAPSATVGANSRRLINDAKSGKAKQPMDLAEKNFGKNLHGGFANFSGVVFRRSAFGILTSGQLDALVGDNPQTIFPKATANAVGRGAAYLTVARGMAKDRVLIGTNIKFGTKAQFDYKLKQANKLSEMGKVSPGEGLKRGNGAGADFGLIVKSNAKSSPRIGVQVRNLGGMKYSSSAPGQPPPDPDLQVLDVGLSVEPGTKKSKARLVADVHDATNANNVSIYKRLHFGGEFTFEDIVGVMGGSHQGYPTYGAFLMLKVVRIEGGMYTEELGERPGDLPDRRYFGRISIGWLK